MPFAYVYSGQKSYGCTRCNWSSKWERQALTADVSAKDLVATFPNGGFVSIGKPDEFGVKLPDATLLKHDPPVEQHFTLHAAEVTERSLGAFATATIGMFMVAAIKANTNRAAPQFYLSMVGIALWCIGLTLHVYGIVKFQGRASVAATVMSYLVSVIVVVTASFTPTNTAATSP